MKEKWTKRTLAGVMAAAMLLTTAEPAFAMREASHTTDRQIETTLLAAAADLGDTSRDIPVEGIKVKAGNSQPGEGPERVLDGDRGTLWHTNWNGSERKVQWIDFDLGKEYPVDGLRYLPREGNSNGTITKYEIWGSTDGEQYSKIAEGDWAKDESLKTARFIPYKLRYLRLQAVDAAGGGFASAAEIRITQAEQTEPYRIDSFTEESHGGWTVAGGTGSMKFHDGVMELFADGGANGNSAYIDMDSPLMDSGYVQATITPVTTSRFGLLFRATDKDHYVGVSNDAGSWGWCGNNGGIWGGLSADKPFRLTAGQPFVLRVVYSGPDVTVFADGVQIAHGAITHGAAPKGPGHVGFRLWGDGGNDTRGHIKVSNIEMGTLSASELPEPEKPDVPVEQVDEFDKDGNYIVSFTDPASHGQLELISGDGTVEFFHGEGSEGYAHIAKKNESQSKAYYLFKRSPKVANGFLEADVTNHSDGRLGLLFRATDANHFVAVTHDVGSAWAIVKNGRNIASFDAGGWSNGETKRVRVDFAGTRVTVSLNGQKVFSRDLPELADTGAGQVGATVWGYANGNNQGKADLDNIVVGRQVAVGITPEEYSMRYEEAGHQDLIVHLGDSAGENPLTEVLLNNVKLNPDTDYVLEGNQLIIKAPVVTEKIREAGGGQFTLVFRDGYTAVMDLVVQAKAQDRQILYVRDFSTDPTKGDKPMQVLGGKAELTYDAEKQSLLISKTSNAFLMDQAAPKLKNCDVEFKFNLKGDGGRFAAVARYADNKNYVTVGPNSSSGSGWLAQAPGASLDLSAYGRPMYGNRAVPYTVRIRFLEKTAVIWVDNYEVWSGPVDALSGGAGLPGIQLHGAEMELLDFRITSVDLPRAENEVGEEHTIASETMKAVLDEKFPRVIRYELEGKTMQGQEIPFYVVELNNQQYVPQVTAEFAPDSACYHMSVEMEPGKTVTFDTRFTVENNVLQMKLVNIDDSACHLYHINFPNQSLVSVPGSAPGAELRANNYTAQEERLDLSKQAAEDVYHSASIVVLSTDELAASINNESYNGYRGISYQTVRNGDHTTTGLWSTGLPYRGLDDKVMFAEPWVKVAVTGDRNADGKVDFQDGAIARRDDCQKDGQKSDAYGYEAVMGSYNTIAMNVGSAVQYPFLRILDNVKKLSLGLDNFPQTVIIKGYNGQGHDSNNNDFTLYNEAAGGLKDFNALMAGSEAYNTKIGIHINETETYPESSTYGRLHTGATGWPWYDVARIIDQDKDALDASAEGLRGRLAQLDKDTLDRLALVYVDVYSGTRWPMYTLVDQLNSMGMAVATEYPTAMAGHSVWAHHVGGGVTQDSTPGNLLRFVNNQYQDIFGGSSLFRGTSRVAGINGWQNASDYNTALSHFYTSTLPNRFLVQYPIMKWTSANEAVLGEQMNVVTKMEGGTNVVTLDGREVVRGNLIFIPFRVDGVEKIYHWNPSGGENSWELPKTFEGQTTVKLFRLSEKGRTDMEIVPVVDGKVTLNTAQNTPYVLYPGDAEAENTGSLEQFGWGEGGPVKDPGFDSFAPGYGWQVENASFWNNDHRNTYLVMNGAEAGSARQTITGLVPGRNYQASVWAEVRDKTAVLSVEDGKQVLAENYMDRSNVIYGVHHTDKYKRYLQRMWVEFTAPESGMVTLTLSGTEGSSDSAYVHFDDVRLVEHTLSDKRGHQYFEDFEHVTEGYGPFVSEESDNSHLSETNAPYTVDTIEGRFSLKTRRPDHFRTLPHTLRLEPNTEYTLGLDFIAGGTGAIMNVSVKSDLAAEAGDKDSAVAGSVICTSTGNWAKNPTAKLTFTTGDYGDYHVDISKAGSVGEYVIDNFYVDKVQKADKRSLQALYDQCAALKEEDYTPESWAELVRQLEAAKAVLEDGNAAEEAVQQAQDALCAAMDGLDAYASAADLERLNKAVTEMEQVSPEHYVQDEHWTAFQTAIAEARTLAGEKKATVRQVDEMIRRLNEAEGELTGLVDKQALTALWKHCNAISSNDVVDGSELVAFLKARTDAETVLENGTAPQDAVDQAEKALRDAFGKIVPKRTTNEGHVDAPIVTRHQNLLAQAMQVEHPSAALTAAIGRAEKASAPMALWKAVEQSIEELEALLAEYAEQDQQAAAAVDKKIESIGTVTLESEATIKAARAAYDALTPAQKALVTKLNVLTAAEKTFAEMNKPVEFPDVKADDWFFDGVQYTAKRGIIVGLIDGSFGPAVTMTRAQLVQMLYALVGRPEIAVTDRFTDVKAGDWYAAAVSWAVEQNITSGVGGGEFAPDAEITRQEMAVMLYAFKGRPAVDGVLDFADGADVADWSAEAVLWAVKSGLMSSVSTEAQLFAPKATATRAQAAVVLMNLDKMNLDKQ